MSASITPEGITSALFFSAVIVSAGIVLYQDPRLRFYIVTLWLFNVADIFAQLIMGSGSHFTPQFWLINYILATLFYAIEYRRNPYLIIHISSALYGCMTVIALALCIIGPDGNKNGIKLGMAMLHILHWGIAIALGWMAVRVVLQKLVQGEYHDT